MSWYLPDGNPLFWNELRRLLRGARWYQLIVLDVVALSIILLAHIFSHPQQVSPPLVADAYDPDCQLLFITQAMIVLLLSPGLTATAITGERERHTLEPLLMTSSP